MFTALTEAHNKIRRAQKATKTLVTFGTEDVGGTLLDDKAITLVSTDKELPAIEINSRSLVQFHKQILRGAHHKL